MGRNSAPLFVYESIVVVRDVCFINRGGVYRCCIWGCAVKSEMMNVVSGQIDLLFNVYVALYGLKSGDMTPEQVNRLDAIKDELGALLGEFIKQNGGVL